MKNAVLILAGGKGERLWPVSRTNWPKFFLNIKGKYSLFQEAFLRAKSLAGIGGTLVVSNQIHRYLLKDHLAKIGVRMPPDNILAEPLAKNTAPAIALGLKKLLAAGDDPVVFIFPADHLMESGRNFAAAMRTAARLARSGYIATLGVKPTAPKTGYGYIRADTSRKIASGAWPVSRFVEKPDLAKAQRYLQAGGYYWNAGIFVGKASVIWSQLAQHAPQIAGPLGAWCPGNSRQLETIYAKLPSISFDYAVMEQTDRAAVVSFDAAWNDLGDWESVYEVLAESQGLRHGCPGIDIDSKNNLVFSTGNRLVVTLGVQDLRIIDTEDALLVLKPEYSQRVKEVVKQLGGNQLLEVHPTVRRPWGSYTVLEARDDYKVKIIEVLAHRAISLQKHLRRREEWTVLNGRGQVRLGKKTFSLGRGQSVKIPKGAAHRLRNDTSRPLKVLELARGKYLEEDDIVRLQDDFQRV